MIKREDIQHSSNTPLYLQLADHISRLIETGALGKNDRLPSVNELCNTLDISRVTIVNAYDYLRKNGVIASKHGKGFYVSKESGLGDKRVFLLFDAMNGYKEVLYRAFADELGENYSIDIFFHYYNKKQFGRFIKNNIGDYHHYAVLPHFNDDVSAILRAIPVSKLLLIDKDVPALKDVAGIYQQFYTDTRTALAQGQELIMKYRKLHLIAYSDFQFVPQGIIEGFVDFCKASGMKYAVDKGLSPEKIRKHEAYLAISDRDLITLIQYAKSNHLKPGDDLGVVSYDDTPLKSVLADGITTISTDFTHMGKMAARMLKEGIQRKIENPSKLIIRSSL